MFQRIVELLALTFCFLVLIFAFVWMATDAMVEESAMPRVHVARVVR